MRDGQVDGHLTSKQTYRLTNRFIEIIDDLTEIELFKVEKIIDVHIGILYIQTRTY